MLCASMIVRNEAHHLGACLGSLAGVIDELVVVDTGSTDDTVSIAIEAGATVLHHPWEDDFAKARNVALDAAAHAGWILYIDADERLAPVTRAEIDVLLDDPEAQAYRILLRPLRGFTPYREYRLWRNDPAIRFEGSIHERVIPAIHRVADRAGRVVKTADLLLEHVGYDGDQSHKLDRNLQLLERRVQETPDNPFNWHHLFRVLWALDRRDDAVVALDRALAAARRRPGDPSGGLAFSQRAHILIGHDEGAARQILDEGMVRYPDNLVIRHLHGRLLVIEGRALEALAVFDALLEVDLATLPDLGPAYDARYFGEWAHESRGLALFRLRRYAEAAVAYGEAASLAPDNLEYRAKRAAAAARQ